MHEPRGLPRTPAARDVRGESGLHPTLWVVRLTPAKSGSPARVETFRLPRAGPLPGERSTRALGGGGLAATLASLPFGVPVCTCLFRQPDVQHVCLVGLSADRGRPGVAECRREAWGKQPWGDVLRGDP